MSLFDSLINVLKPLTSQPYAQDRYTRANIYRGVPDDVGARTFPTFGGGSNIVINSDSEQDPEFYKRIIQHEIVHAIQNKYGAVGSENQAYGLANPQDAPMLLPTKTRQQILDAVTDPKMKGTLSRIGFGK